MADDVGVRKVGVVGTGMVGASFAYALMQSGLASELVLVDRDQGRAEGEAMDLNHGLPFLRAMRISAGDYPALAGAAVVVVCAGANQKPGETRLDLLAKNLGVFRDVIPRIVAAAPEAVIVIATNPVDILTQVSADLAGLPPGRVLGSGTTLDSARFRFNIATHLGIDPRSVHAMIIAEHGDTAVPAWSLANVAGVNLAKYAGDRLPAALREDIFTRTRDAAYEIIRRKGSTYYAIGIALLTIVEAVLRDQHSVLTVTSPLRGVMGVQGMALALPTVVGARGAEHIIAPPLNEAESAGFAASASALKERLAAVG
jgi:L-lactate dehydrogenase